MSEGMPKCCQSIPHAYSHECAIMHSAWLALLTKHTITYTLLQLSSTALHDFHWQCFCWWKNKQSRARGWHSACM